jgi:hypothetical protein
VNEIFEKLYKDIDPDAIQRTNKAETKKGYDTTGYGYQWCVDRFNDVAGETWGFDYKILKEITGAFKSGQPFYDITVEVAIWIDAKIAPRKCIGGHLSASYADALKGAITNGFKKTAAFWGVGAAAYRGELDDDNVPQPYDGPMPSAKPVGKVVPFEAPKPDIEAARKATREHMEKHEPMLSIGKPEMFKSDIAKAKTTEDLRAIYKAITDDAQEVLF